MLFRSVAGLISTRGTAPGTCETLGITLIVSAIVVWVASSGLGIALAEMGEKFVAASAGAAAGDAASIAAVGGMQIAAGFTQATNVAISTLGGLLAGIGWICIGLAYRGSDAKGLLSFIPLGWLALIQGLILVVATLIISTVVSVDTGSQVSRSEEHTSELQSLVNLVCRLLLEKKKKNNNLHNMELNRDTQASRS